MFESILIGSWNIYWIRAILFLSISTII
jgi:hypothetical protein